ncbi:MAG: hypothetical protein ACT6T0_05340 [Nevskia sp.]|uniref:hypothetical protein n=1 Tax=Nevskia sp. TaxID=1929292 RepID=UPI0040372311
MDSSWGKTVSKSELMGQCPTLDRATWLNGLIAHIDIYAMQDGEFSKALLAECFSCFVNGHLIATVILGFSLIERTFAGRLDYVGEGKSVTRGSSRKLFEAAQKKGWLTENELSALNDIRALRNPVAHFNEPFDATRPEIRAALNARTGYMQMEKDAKAVLEAAVRVLVKTAL